MIHKKYLKQKLASTVGVSLTLWGITGAQVADDSDIVELPKLVVTGDLWESEFQKTTASVSLIDIQSAPSAAFQHMSDLKELVPGLTSTGGTSRPRYFQIRGVGENSQFEGETPDSAVSFQIDDLDFTGLGSVGTLLDIRQVEVLRGPQAGAFGANAAGGMIRLVSNDPTPYWTGHASATVGSDNLYSGEFAIGGPLLESDPDQLMVRVAVQDLKSDGFYENKFLSRSDTNERDEFAARLKLRWNPNDQSTWDGTLFYANADNGYDIFTMGDTPFETFSNEPGRDEQESLGTSLKGRIHLNDALALTTKSAFMQTDSLYSYDADWTDGSYAGFLSTERDREVWTQEIRVDGELSEDRQWTLGVYYQSLREESNVFYVDGDQTGGESDFGKVFADSDYKTKTLALFGQVDHYLSEKTRVIFGLRFEAHDVRFDSVSTQEGYYRGFVYSGGSEQDDDVLGGKITIEHRFENTLLGFVSIAKGYKAGGANSATFTTPELPLTYEQESLWNFEAGLRGSWLEERLSAQITAFYLHREDSQLRDSVGAGGFFRFLTVNGDSAAHVGIEAEMQWILSNEWKLLGGISLLDTSREAYSDPGGIVPERELANAPAYQYNLRLIYESESGLHGSFVLSGSDSYFESNSHDQEREGVTLVHVNAGYRYENWTWSVWVKNLFDKEYASRVFYFDNGDGLRRHEGLADPQQIGTTISYRF